MPFTIFNRIEYTNKYVNNYPLFDSEEEAKEFYIRTVEKETGMEEEEIMEDTEILEVPENWEEICKEQEIDLISSDCLDELMDW